MTAPAETSKNDHSAIITKTLDTKPKAAWRSQDFTGYNQGEDIQEVYIRNIRNNARNTKIGNDPMKRSKEGIGYRSKKFQKDDPNDNPRSQAKKVL